MKNCLLVTCFIAAFPLFTSAAPDAAKTQALLAGQPLLFTENRGQVADTKGQPRPDILFIAHSGGTQVFITAGSIEYQFVKTTLPEGYGHGARKAADMAQQAASAGSVTTETHHFSLALSGANPSPVVRREAKNEYTESFYLAQCPQGITGVATYERIVLEGVYPGIDWVIYSNRQGMKYDFVVHPGADASLIKLRVKDADSVSITAEGELLMKTSLGEVREAPPVSFSQGKKVETQFKQDAGGMISFVLAAYDKSQSLKIDPVVSWATYYGGGATDLGQGCAVDGSGNVYIAGSTQSASGIASGGFQNTLSGYGDAFLVKFNSSGARLWATYYGGNNGAAGNGCCVDGIGNIYLIGATASTTGIASGGVQNTFGGYSDAFLVKFNSSGSRLWATYYGGSNDDAAYICTTDVKGNVYLAGSTLSTSGIASGGFQNSFGGGNNHAFLVKFNSSGSRKWATYYGGSATGDATDAIGCSIDGSGNVYLSGSTNSAAGIASGGFQNTITGGYLTDLYLVKFDSSGGRLWGTYYGSSAIEFGGSCSTDAAGNVYLAGTTFSSSGIASGGFQNTFGGGTNDAFLVKFNSAGARQWATYYGGSDAEAGYSCCVDGSGNIFLCGNTASASGISSGGFQNTFAASNRYAAYIVKFNSSGARVWGSYYGGNNGTSAYFCTTDGLGNIYLAGETESSSGISSGGYQNSYSGQADAFLAKIVDVGIQQPAAASLTLCPGDAISSIAFSTTSSFNSNNVFKLELSTAGGTFGTVPPVLATTSGSGSLSFSNVTIPTNTASGSYMLRITSSSPAAVFPLTTITLTVNQAVNLSSLSITHSNPSTCTAQNGSITFSGLLPNTAYTVAGNKSGGGGFNTTTFSYAFTTNSSGSGTVSSLATGNYFNMGFSAAGYCPASHIGTTSLTSSTTSVVPISTNSPVCIGDAFYMNIPTPVAGTTISWDGPGSQSASTQNISGSNALQIYQGIWTVTLTKNGCSAYGSVDFRVYRSPTITNVTPTQQSGCGTNDGSLVISATQRPDTGYISYDLNGVTQPAVMVLPNGSGDYVVSGLGAGIYNNITLAVPGGHCSDVSTAVLTIGTPQVVGLGYSAIAPASVTLTWPQPATNQPGWDVYVSTSATAPSNTATPTANVTTNSATVGSLTASTHYYAWVRANCGTGNISIWSYSIEFTTPPANDDASGAIAVTVGGGCSNAPYTNVGATQLSGTEPLAACNQTQAGAATVWFSFVAPSSGTARVSTDYSGGTLPDTRVAVFSATNVANYSTFSLVACDEDNGTTVSGASVAYAVGLTPSATYYVQVSGGASGAEQGSFCLRVDSLSTTFINSSSASCTAAKTPVGINTAYTGPVSIVDNSNSKLIAIVQNAAGGAANGYYGAYTVNTGALRSVGAASAYYLDRNYQIENSDATNVDVSFFFLSTELATLTASDPTATLSTLKATHYSGATCATNYAPNGAATQVLAQTGSGAANGVSWIRVNTPSFSNFFLHGGSNAPLPILLLDISADAEGYRNRIAWETAHEDAGTAFTVERAASDGSFLAIGDVRGAGNASHYTFYDTAPKDGRNDYRLRIVDGPGVATYSRIVSVLRKGDAGFRITAIPNPASDALTLRVANAAGTAVLTVSDAVGKTVWRGTLDTPAYRLDVRFLPAGMYQLRYQDEQHTEAIRFLKQ